MTKSIRWRIIVLQVVMVLVLGLAAGGALYASNFITTLFCHIGIEARKIGPSSSAADQSKQES